MSRRFIHAEGSEAFPANAADEAALRAIGFQPAVDGGSEAKPPKELKAPKPPKE